MVKFKLWVSIFLFTLCVFLTTCAASSQQQPPQVIRTAIATTTKSKPELAKALFSEIGIAKKYDLYLGNIVEAVFPPSQNSRFKAWLQQVYAREAGWKYVESKYIAQLEANFSEAELKELLNLAKQPVMKKLLQAEIQAYADTVGIRSQLFNNVWNDYNSGKMNPPPEAL